MKTKMRKIFAALLVVVMVIGLMAGCSGSNNSEDTEPAEETEEATSEPVTLMVSHSNAEGGGTAVASEEFKKIVEGLDDTIQIDIYGNNSLGDESTVIESVLSGTVAMQMVSTSTLSKIVEEASVMDVPFLFDTMDQFWDVVQTEEFYDAFSATFEGSGLHFLGFINCNSRAVSNTVRPIHTPSDMEGLNIRILEGAVYQDLFKALGSGTTTLAISEVYTSLQNGLIDGEDMGISYIVPSGFVDAEKYYTDTNHTVQPVAAIINEGIWDSMSAAQQEAMEEALKEAGSNAGARFEEDYASYLKTAEEEYGIEITYLTDEERQAFKDAAADVIEKYASLTEGSQELYEVIESLK